MFEISTTELFAKVHLKQKKIELKPKIPYLRIFQLEFEKNICLI